MSLALRLAHPQEAALLSGLAFASKAHWGYSAEFMEACREDLTLSGEVIAAGLTWVAERQNRILGFSRLEETPRGPYLKDLFVTPEVIGQGVGKLLWQHAGGHARSLGWSFFLLDSEPHAEGFYRSMGAEKVGEVSSTVFPGRVLPHMRFDLT